MSRIDILTTRMFSLMPVSPVTIEGPRIGRARIMAAAIAGDASFVSVLGLEPQVAEAISQLSPGAHLERVDNVYPPGAVDPIRATDWTLAESAFWLFTPILNDNAGASGIFLNQWGKMIQVPKYDNESENNYAKRIISEAIMPSLSNIGMAQLIDNMLGTHDTEVVNAANYDNQNLWRLNDGYRLNDGMRWASYGIFNALSYWNCFVVILSVDLPHNGYTNDDINSLVDRHKAAGNRKISTVTPHNIYPDQ